MRIKLVHEGYIEKAVEDAAVAAGHEIVRVGKDGSGDAESPAPADAIVVCLRDETLVDAGVVVREHRAAEGGKLIVVSSVMCWAGPSDTSASSSSVPGASPDDSAADAAEGADSSDPATQKPAPLSESDFLTRVPSVKCAGWKSVETQALKSGDGVTVVGAGIAYGRGEGAFMPLFRNAWEAVSWCQEAWKCVCVCVCVTS